jgi:acyl-CoA thioester hydrolase
MTTTDSTLPDNALDSSPVDFAIRLSVRAYELDVLGHLNQAVYLQYAEHARWEMLGEVGVRPNDLVASGVAPVTLRTTVEYFRELRGGDQVDIISAVEFEPGGRTFEIPQSIRKVDGRVSAKVRSVCGIIDLSSRRLVADSFSCMRSFSADPESLDSLMAASKLVRP